MKRVTGLGGVFVKCKDKAFMVDWYRLHLGIDLEEWGVVFNMDNSLTYHPKAYQVFGLFKNDTQYFSPSESNFMLNFTVADLDKLLIQLKLEGVQVLEKTEENEFGKFAWIIDPENNKIELWQPPN